LGWALVYSLAKIGPPKKPLNLKSHVANEGDVAKRCDTKLCLELCDWIFGLETENCLPLVQEQGLMARMLAWNNRYVIGEAIKIED